MNIDLRVSTKGAVSFYGLNRFPFTLYRDEWKAVFEARNVILSFIATHHLQLSCRCGEDLRYEVRLAFERGAIPLVNRHGALWCRRATTRAVSLYGLRRFPVTLYCDQWLRVLNLDAQEQIESFIRANDARLETKGCCVPRGRSGSGSAGSGGVPSFVGPDNIRRPMAAMSEGR